MAKTTHKKHKFQQFLKVQPKAIELPSAEELVTLDYLQPEQTIPLVISPAINNIDIIHHISYLDRKVRKSLLSIFSSESLPRNVYYGDGSPIEEKEIFAINQAYQQAKASFLWQKGDVLMLDNILTAHSRNSYQGKRKLWWLWEILQITNE